VRLRRRAIIADEQTVETTNRRFFIAGLAALVLLGAITLCRASAEIAAGLATVARQISFGALIGAGFWAASHVLNRHGRHRLRPATPPRPPAVPMPKFTPPPPTGPGRYVVRGVDEDTHFDTVEVVYADSPKNAKFKVELKGVQVQAVEKA